MPTDESTGMDEGIFGGFGWYFGKIKINPKNENDVFVLGIDMYRGNFETSTWSIAVPDWWSYEVHADKHDLVFSEDEMFLATDGGLYSAIIQPTLNWQDIENIPATEFYRTAYNPNFPELYYGGAQDNGTTGGNIFFIDEWERIFGGDGFQAVFHPTNDQVFYIETQNGNISVTKDGGQSFSDGDSGIKGSKHWDMQYFMSSHNPDILFAGSDKMYKSETGATPDFTAISDLLIDSTANTLIHQITSLSQSTINPKVLYAGTTDGMVWRTTNGAENLEWQLINSGLPKNYVSSIKASPNIENNVYITMTGYRDGNFEPRLYKSFDNGTSWQSIHGNLPNLSINDVFIYPSHDDQILFIANYAGVYFTRDGGLYWERLGSNMPMIQVNDLELNIKNNELVAATYGRGIQSFSLDQVNINLLIATKDEGHNNMKVYPTVTSSYIDISHAKGTVEIMDAKGLLVLTSKINGNISLDLSRLNPGIYFVRHKKSTVKIAKI
jgi:hypothetical protein